MVGAIATTTKKPSETSHPATVTSGFPFRLLVSIIERKKWKCYQLKIRAHTESCRKKGKGISYKNVTRRTIRRKVKRKRKTVTTGENVTTTQGGEK